MMSVSTNLILLSAGVTCVSGQFSRWSGDGISCEVYESI